MTQRFRALMAPTMLLVLLAATSLTAAQTEAPQVSDRDASKANVLITVRIGKTEGSNRIPVKSYSLVVADGTPGAKLLSGQRVPFPTASKQTADGSGDDGGEMKDFIYQNIGFVTEARVRLLDKKTIHLIAEIEDSRMRESQDGKPPIVETRQLRVNAMLTDGVPLELTRVEGISDQAGFVEVEAKILR